MRAHRGSIAGIAENKYGSGKLRICSPEKGAEAPVHTGGLEQTWSDGKNSPILGINPENLHLQESIGQEGSDQVVASFFGDGTCNVGEHWDPPG